MVHESSQDGKDVEGNLETAPDSKRTGAPLIMENQMENKMENEMETTKHRIM